MSAHTPSHTRLLTPEGTSSPSPAPHQQHHALHSPPSLLGISVGSNVPSASYLLNRAGSYTLPLLNCAGSHGHHGCDLLQNIRGLKSDVELLKRMVAAQTLLLTNLRDLMVSKLPATDQGTQTAYCDFATPTKLSDGLTSTSQPLPSFSLPNDQWHGTMATEERPCGLNGPLNIASTLSPYISSDQPPSAPHMAHAPWSQNLVSKHGCPNSHSSITCGDIPPTQEPNQQTTLNEAGRPTHDTAQHSTDGRHALPTREEVKIASNLQNMIRTNSAQTTEVDLKPGTRTLVKPVPGALCAQALMIGLDPLDPSTHATWKALNQKIVIYMSVIEPKWLNGGRVLTTSIKTLGDQIHGSPGLTAISSDKTKLVNLVLYLRRKRIHSRSWQKKSRSIMSSLAA